MDNWETFLAGSDDGSVDTSQSQDEGPVASLSMVAPESPSYDVTDDDGAALDVEDDANSPDIEYNLLTALPVESIRLNSVDTLDIVDIMDPNEHIPHDLSDNLRLAPRSGPVGLENDGRNGMKGKNVPRPLPLILSEPSACLDLDRGGSTADSHLEVSHNSSVVNNGVSFQPSCASSPKKKIKWSLDINFDKTLGIVNSMDSPHDTSNTAINGATDRKSENTLLCQTDRNTYWQTRKSVKVAVRVRPPLKQEIESKFTRVVSFANNQDDTRERVCIMNPTVASVEDPDEVAADISSEQIPEWARLFEDMDHCFWSYGPVDSGGMYVKQRDVHQAIGAEIVYHAWNGMSSTCVCYGQTNSGKSHTMFGSVIPKQMCTSDPQSVQNIDMVTVNEGKYGKYKVPQSSLKKNPSYKDSAACSISASSTKATLLEESVGLIPRVFKDLILKVARVNDNECDTKCVLSFYEIYNDKIRDLLAGDLHSQGQGQRELKQREHPVLGPYIEGLKKFPVTDVDHMLKLVSKGNSNRNYNLSDGRTFYHTRSHAVVVLELVPFTQLDPVYGDYVSAPVVSLSRTRGSGADYSDYRCVKVQMVELAGPEKCSPSSVNILEKLEANKIGTSLSTLGRVIHSLVKTHSSHSGSKRTPNHRLDISGASGPISVDTSIVGSSSDTPITDEEAISYQHYQTLQKLSGFTGAKSPNSLSNASKLPFRESLLTWLLKDGLYDRSGVRGFVSCIATISPAGSCYEESLQVLHFAHRLCCRTSFPALDIDKFGSKDESGDLASPHPPDVEDKFSDGFDKIIAEEAHVDGDNLRLLNAEMGSEDVSYGLFSDENLQNISFVSSVSPLLTEKKPEGNISNSDALLMEGVKYGGASSLNTTKTNVEIRSSPELGSVGNILGSPSSVAIRDTYRELHSRLVEMQIELQNTKTDRDSLRVELLGSRETIAILQAKNAELRLKNVSQSVGGSLIGNSASNDATSGLNMTIGEEFEVQFPKESPSAHTKPSSHGLNNVDNINVRSSLDSYSDEDEDLHQSVLYLKGLIARKEHTIEGLLSEVKEERRFREAAEKLNETQMLDFLERVDSLRRLSDEANDEMRRIHNEEKEALVASNEELSKKLVEMGEKLVAVEHGLSDEDKWDMLRQEYASTARSLKAARDSAITTAENDRNRLKVNANVPLSQDATITMVSSPQKSPLSSDPAAYAELLKKYQSLYDKHIALGVSFNRLKEFSPHIENAIETPESSIHYKALNQLQQMLTTLTSLILPHNVSAVSGLSTSDVEVAVQGVNTCFHTVKHQYISLLESKLSEGSVGLTANPHQVELAYYRDKCMEYESQQGSGKGVGKDSGDNVGGNGVDVLLQYDYNRLQQENEILSRKLSAAISAKSKEGVVRDDDEKEKIIRGLEEEIDCMKIDRSKLKRHLEKMTKQRDSLQKEIEEIDQDLLRAVRNENLESEVFGSMDEPFRPVPRQHAHTQPHHQHSRPHSNNLVADRRRHSRSNTPSETRSRSRSGTPTATRTTGRDQFSNSAIVSRSSTPSDIKRAVKPVKAVPRVDPSVGLPQNEEDDLATRHYSSVQEMQNLIDRKVALTFLRNGDIPTEAMTESRPKGSSNGPQIRRHSGSTNNYSYNQGVYGGTDVYHMQPPSHISAGSERPRSRSSAVRKSGTSASNMSSLASSSRGHMDTYDSSSVRGGRTSYAAPFYNKLN